MAGVKIFEWDRDNPLARVKYPDPYDGGRVKSEPKNAVLMLGAYAQQGTQRPVLSVFYDNYVTTAQKRAESGKVTRRLLSRYTIKKYSMDFRWMARLARYDELEREQYARERRAAAQADREVRIKILEAYRAQVVKALSLIDPASASWREVTAAIKMITVELRTEHAGMGGSETVAAAEEVAPDNALDDLTDEELVDAIANIEQATVAIAD